ncbi:prealbumin-like fold domain-containing protein [Enterococcus plantarum]|uniref:prealbumin-like fold domain-containing protein n=1 Tax=Enterococcus plantarum TaxID=1077675 RepID=UPI001F5F6087|nr:prealbumin-like fold domain-containing protein [Enterococcus plantarum]
MPKTGIQILDKDGKIVVEGRTDEKGQFKFKGLPAGNYTFKEFDPPEGYELDETPLPFEIAEDNEIVKCEMTNKKIPEKLEPKNPQPKEKGRLPQTGEQKRNRVVVVIGLLLIVSFAGGIGYKRYLKNFNKDN